MGETRIGFINEPVQKNLDPSQIPTHMGTSPTIKTAILSGKCTAGGYAKGETLEQNHLSDLGCTNQLGTGFITLGN